MAERQSSAPGAAQLSIGALSAATGINVETIRSWERRYGYPRAQRKPSGHRVYPLSAVERLRRIARAIARGHRTAEVIAASDRQLDLLLDALPKVGDAPATSRADGRGARVIAHPGDDQELVAAVRAFDVDHLKRLLQSDWARLGPLEFLEQRAAPFLKHIGDAWERGTMDVRHEHFASAVLGDFLRVVRQPLEDRASGPVAALATMPGELHGLGLQMAALVFALAGWRVVLLGTDTPVKQVSALAREAPLSAIAISVITSPAGKGAAEHRRSVALLRSAVPKHVPILIGGAGATGVRARRGVAALSDLYELDRWARSFSAA